MDLISNFSIDKKKYSLNITGNLANSTDEVLLEKEDNIISKTNWQLSGFTILRLLDKNTQKNLQDSVISFLTEKINTIFKEISLKDSELKNYHKLVNNNQHYELLRALEGGNGEYSKIRFKDINFDKKILEDAVSDELKIKVSTKNRYSDEIDPDTFSFRVVRPNQYDFNPPHKDIYLDRLKNGVNIYMPIIGSNKFSSLPILPGSHLYNEKDISRTENGCIINKKKFRVPSIINTKFGFDLIRPNPSKDEILLFSPYLVHGGGSNDNKDITRVSLELRFWRV